MLASLVEAGLQGEVDLLELGEVDFCCLVFLLLGDEVHGDEHGVREVPPCAVEAEGVEGPLELVDAALWLVEAAADFGDFEDARLRSQDAARFADEVPLGGSHQGQAEDDDVDGVVLEGRVGDVARGHEGFRLDEVERPYVVLRRESLRQSSVAAAHVRDDEARRQTSKAPDNVVQGIRRPLRRLFAEAPMVGLHECGLL
mmetsp:Transcript_32403/g.103313  ORF Transcript_32403/g.103313 Transcript_32403/m.103313 type:complete len:200 (-) Transcript_32403:174-773(-)